MAIPPWVPDWNGNGQIDLQDIALTLTIAESEETEENIV